MSHDVAGRGLELCELADRVEPGGSRWRQRNCNVPAKCLERLDEVLTDFLDAAGAAGDKADHLWLGGHATARQRSASPRSSEDRPPLAGARRSSVLMVSLADVFCRTSVGASRSASSSRSSASSSWRPRYVSARAISMRCTTRRSTGR